MNARRFATVGLVLTMAASAYYFFAYLTWWEWNRAMIAGILLVAAEVGLGVLLVLARIDDLKRRVGASAARADRINARLQANAAPSKRFEWLARPERMGVFVPVLLGAGVVASALAWLVERLARATSRPGNTLALSRHLADLGPREGGFLAGDDPLDILQRPQSR